MVITKMLQLNMREADSPQQIIFRAILGQEWEGIPQTEVEHRTIVHSLL